MKRIIIQGSSRSNGNTAKIAQFLQEKVKCDRIDLKTYKIGHYDYEHKNKDDDFIPLIRKITNDYDILIFASPVYWYTMSGRTKLFMDRISDCLGVEKEIGKKFRGKYMAVLSCGSSPERIESFFVPFQKSAAYLGMEYLGDVHTWVQNNALPKEIQKNIGSFASKIKALDNNSL